MALYVGLMSGTSMDGIDAALVDMPSNQLIHGITKKYSEEVHMALSRLMSELHTTLADFCQLNTLVGRDFAYAVHQLLAESGYCATDIRAIGSHGQTVCHDTTAVVPYTLQLGCGHTISSLTGIDVIADFRTRDLVHGGQGAPFAPLYHQELFGSYGEHAAVVNVGGIANVTFLSPGQVTEGWDIGPGNCLMDAWINRHLTKPYDESGNWAAQGRVIQPLLDHLLSDAFFHQPSPKSIGKEYFSLSWLEPHLKKRYNHADVQATLLALTAWSVAESIAKNRPKTKKLYLCGGGAHNIQLHQTLANFLPNTLITSVNQLGVNPDYLEAMMFAWLASQTINSIAVDFSFITGSQKKAILGAIYPFTP